MTESIKPALTPREWERCAETARLNNAVPFFIYMDNGDEARRRRHSVAALALYGQPFGFTWEDVDALHEWCGSIDWEGGYVRRGVIEPCGDCVICSLVDRIAALLPPRETAPSPDKE